NQTKKEYKELSDVCVTLHSFFELEAERTPDTIALIYEAEQVSYERLNRESNKLAWYLLSKGIKNESIIGIRLDRSIELVVSLLATLKSGAAYVPLDMSYSRLRLQMMIEDAGVSALITRHSIEGEEATEPEVEQKIY